MKIEGDVDLSILYGTVILGYLTGLRVVNVCALHVQLCSEFTTHRTYSLVLNLVPGIVSGTKRDCTSTTRVVV